MINFTIHSLNAAMLMKVMKNEITNPKRQLNTNVTPIKCVCRDLGSVQRNSLNGIHYMCAGSIYIYIIEIHRRVSISLSDISCVCALSARLCVLCCYRSFQTRELRVRINLIKERESPIESAARSTALSELMDRWNNN